MKLVVFLLIINFWYLGLYTSHVKAKDYKKDDPIKTKYIYEKKENLKLKSEKKEKSQPDKEVIKQIDKKLLESKKLNKTNKQDLENNIDVFFLDKKNDDELNIDIKKFSFEKLNAKKERRKKVERFINNLNKIDSDKSEIISLNKENIKLINLSINKKFKILEKSLQISKENLNNTEFNFPYYGNKLHYLKRIKNINEQLEYISKTLQVMGIRSN